MKKLFAVTLLIALLCQALPMEALASAGWELSKDEIARARALTGLSFGQDPGNERAYHSGMKPNAGWTAKQLRGWLDEKLDKDLGSTCDVLSQAFYTLADMQKSDPAKYRQFTENGQYTNALSIQQKAEKLREEMRYYRDQILQASSLIAEMSRWLAEERSAIFDSDAVRYSAKISEAQQKIVRLRAGILEKADGWESDIANLKRYLQFGPSPEDHMLGVGEWMELLLKDDKPVVKTAALTRTNNSNSRASRLQMASGLLGDADAQITVYSDNEVVIQLQAEVDGELVPVGGVSVNTRDALNPDSQWDEKKSVNGAVLVPINELTADEYDVFHLGVEINPYDQGYRNIVFEDLDMERGTVFNCLLTPIESVRDNSDVERPYPYMMSFNHRDIMESEFQMVFSYVNDYDIEIKVGVANTNNFQGIKMHYYDAQGNACEVGPTSQSGDVYIFKGPWKQTFYPFASEDQRPAFILTDKEGDQTFPSQLVSIKSATDDPINAGTGPDGGVFAKVLDQFTCSFKVPFVDINVSLNLPLKAYVPKFSVNPGGYVVVYVGNPVLEDDIRDKTTGLWKSKDAKDYARAQKSIEAKGAFAKYAANYALACDYYKEQKFKCLRDFSVDVGWFVVATGRWELDDDYEGILSKLPRIGYETYHDDHPTLKNVMLTGTGTSYVNAAFSDVESIPEEDRPKRTPVSVCSVPEMLKPSANMITAVPEELLVKAGSFDDFMLGVMNDGNMAIASLDLAMYEVTDSGDENLVETAHIDALDPTKNAVTMADGTVVQSGESAGYRNEDYDKPPRRRDWVLDHEALAYKIHMADGKATVDKQTVEPSDPQHITTDILMPGSAAGYTVSYKIPDNWEGGVKTLRMKVTSASTFANWMRAAALAAGARANGTLASANANGELVELKYVLNEKTGRLELQKPANLTASLSDALQSGLIASEFETGSVPVTVEIHDLEVDHRVYRGLGGERWLDIILRNHAATREGMKLVCAVYVDGAKEPEYINLPYYENAALSHKTQTISLPVSALVDDPDAHRIARVEILSVERDERAYANNEFTVYLGGEAALAIVKQLVSQTVSVGGTVTFTVSVAGGKPPYKYQWQVFVNGEWQDIPGANTATLTLENVKADWNGRRTRCIITDAAGTTVVSDEAVLTVIGQDAETEADDNRPDTGDHTHLPLYLAVAAVSLILLWLLRRRARRAK